MVEAAARAKVLRQHLHTGLGKGCEASVTGDREWGGVWGDQVGEGGQGHLTQAWVKVLVTGKSMLTFIEHSSWALFYVGLLFFIQQHGGWGGWAGTGILRALRGAPTTHPSGSWLLLGLLALEGLLGLTRL